jgi:N-methylhydantoinase A
VVAALHLMRASNLPRVVTMDLGGTSADLCVLSEGHVPYAWDQEIEGLPVTLPSVDVSSIGAGGGSIAYADNLGLLRVGPQSAGADPGPVAYGRGGKYPTLTDAYLVSGFIDPASFLGGELPLDVDRAREALDELARTLNLGLRETAAGIIRVATSSLAAEFTRLAAKKGIDPREFVLVAFGGAGPTHACLLAEEMHIPHIAIPASPGTFCAMGSVLADFRLDYLKTVYGPLEDVSQADVDTWVGEVEARAHETLRAAATDVVGIQTLRTADLRYLGQGYEVPIPFERLDDLPERFRSEYRRLYGPRGDEAPLEIINIRATVLGSTRPMAFRWTGGSRVEPAKGTRRVDVLGREYECPVYVRAGMPPGWQARGPFIVEQPDTTGVVTAGWAAEVDAVGTLHLRKES